MKNNENDWKHAILKPQRMDSADSCKRFLKPTWLVISWPLESWMSYAVAEYPAFFHVLLTFCVAPKRSKQWWTILVLVIMSRISSFNSGTWSSALYHLAANGEYKMLGQVPVINAIHFVDMSSENLPHFEKWFITDPFCTVWLGLQEWG